MDRYLTVPTVCEALNVSRQTIWRWVKNGDFPPPVNLGERKVAFRASDVARWEASRPAAMTGGAPKGLRYGVGAEA